MDAEKKEMAARLRLALDLFEAGESMLRARLAREAPDASDEEIEARVEQWLSSRPGAEAGDAAGRASVWPRRR